MQRLSGWNMPWVRSVVRPGRPPLCRSSVSRALTCWAWLTGIVCAFGGGLASSGEPEFLRRVWTRENGLPHNTVRALLQTRDGYLWVGTRSGAARFDGRKFFVLSHGDFPAMVSDDCRVLAEDAAGSLWIGTDQGLLRWQGGRLTRFTTRDGLLSNSILSLSASASGVLWIGTDQGISRLGLEGVTSITARDGLRPGGVVALCEDRAGGVWAGVPNGVQRRAPGAQRFEDFPLPLESGIDAVRPHCLHLDPQGAIWIDNARMLCRVEPEFGQVAVYPGMLTDGRATSMSSDAAGALWIADGSYGLVRFSHGWSRGYPVRDRPGLDDAYCVAVDREGSIWIGTETGGLHCWQPRVLTVLSTANGLRHNKVRTVCEAAADDVWIGTDAGVSLLQDGSVRPVPWSENLPHPTVRALAPEPSGTLWIGTGNGLARLHEGRLRAYRFEGADPTDPDGKGRNKVRAIATTADGSTWIAVPTGLHRLIRGQETFFEASPGGHGLPHADVRALLEARDGSLWIATAGGGVARVTGLASRRERLQWTVYSTASGLSSDYACALYEDADGVLWVGTERGLSRVAVPDRGLAADPATQAADSAAGCQPAIRSFTRRYGLPDDRVNAILEDDQGRLWISHDRGLCRVSKQDLEAVASGRIPAARCVAYGESDGLPVADTNGQVSQPAACATRDGRLWFATPKGLVVIDPRDICDHPTPPPVVIERVEADGEVVFSDGAVAGLERPMTPIPFRAVANGHGEPRASLVIGRCDEAPELRLPPSRGRHLTFHFTANTFVQPSQVRFKHRLEGHDSAWIDDGVQRQAAYTLVTPGRYRLRVIAANAHGRWNETGATLAFVLTPFSHQTWWFRAACATGLLLALAAFACWRWRELRRFHALERQQAVATERERIARDLHDELGADLHQISLLSELARRGGAGAAFLSHLDQIGQTARDSLRTLSQTIWTLEPRSASLASVADYIGDFAQRIFAAAGVRCRVEIPPTWPDAELAARERHAVLAAAKESFRNILKHAGATEVRLRFSVAERAFYLTIEDNGRGFAPKPASTAATHTNSAIGNPRSSGGPGLRNVAHRLIELGGQFRCDSVPSHGTTVVMSIPFTALPNETRPPDPPSAP